MQWNLLSYPGVFFEVYRPNEIWINIRERFYIENCKNSLYHALDFHQDKMTYFQSFAKTSRMQSVKNVNYAYKIVICSNFMCQLKDAKSKSFLLV